MASTTQQQHPSPVLSLNPYLRVRSAAKAITFYQSVFNAHLTLSLQEPSGRIGHAELTFPSPNTTTNNSNSKIQLSDEYPEIDIYAPAKGSQAGMMISVQVKDCEGVYKKALEEGAVCVREPKNYFYGHCVAQFRDPFEHVWSVFEVVEGLSYGEIKEKWDKMMGKDEGEQK